MNPLVCFSNEGLNLGTLSNQSILNFNNYGTRPPFLSPIHMPNKTSLLMWCPNSNRSLPQQNKLCWEGTMREREREIGGDWRPLTWKRVMALDYVLNGHDCSKDILIIPCWDNEHKSIIIWVFYSMLTHHFFSFNPSKVT